MAQQDDTRRQWAKLVAMAWMDEGFKKRLESDPAKVLAENGIDIPSGAKVRVIESAADELVLPLPAKPANVSGGVQEVSERLQTSGWCMMCAGCH
jgi:hypothetical protein